MSDASETIIPEKCVGSKTSAQRKTFDIDTLRLFLRYEPETGRLFWRERAESWFPAPRFAAGWNKRNAGREVTNSNHGYLSLTITGENFLGHRVIWAMVHGEWPDSIDHIDGNPRNNKLANLRSVSLAENLRNVKTKRDAQSGIANVKHIPKSKHGPERWQVVLQKTLTKPKVTKVFFSLQDALDFRDERLAEAGFHPNHGRSEAERAARAVFERAELEREFERRVQEAIRAL